MVSLLKQQTVHHKILPIMELENTKFNSKIQKLLIRMSDRYWKVIKNVEAAKKNMMKKIKWKNLNLIVNGQTNRFSWQIKTKI
jgi:hypothetical protein